MRKLKWTLTLFAIVLSGGRICLADDWPQWLGPQRDGTWREDGIIASIPSEGLKILWRTPIQGGYAGPAVADGRVFVTDFVRRGDNTPNNPNARSVVQGSERVLCLAVDGGEILWQHKYDCPYDISYAAGPRCTPTVAGQRVFTLGSEGDLLCLDVKTGDVIWEKNLPKEYQTKVAAWGYSSHPLVYQDLLICIAGGTGSQAVAFDKATGEVKWTSLSAKEQGYCSPTIIKSGERDQLLIWDAERLSALNPLDGSVVWAKQLEPQYGMSIATPRVSGDLLFLSAIGNVGGAFRINEGGSQVESVWQVTPTIGMACGMSTPFIEDGVVYGADCRSGGLRAVDLETGKQFWETFKPTTGERRAGHGNAFLIKHQDRFFLFSETGDLIIANLSRAGYEELGRAHLLEPTGEAFGRNVVWSHPAFANGCCFVRNDREIACVSLRADR